jgi:hypothetical protein
LGALVEFSLFDESFVFEVFNEDLGMISSFSMLVDFQVVFAMFLLCYA